MPKTAKQYLDCEQALEKKKNLWKIQWQLVSEYVHQRRADFTTTMQPGAFISQNIWSDDPVHMAETSASAFLGYVWAAGEKSFKLIGNENIFGKDPALKKWWQEKTEILQAEMGDQEAGLSTALDESILDFIVLGTDFVLTEERNQENKKLGCLAYEPLSLLQVSIAQDASGRAAKFYMRRKYTVEQMVDKYGQNNVSKKVSELYARKTYDTEIVVLHVIEPREEKDRVKNSIAAKDMPIASVHIEVDTKHICKNSGYPEMPMACARLSKRINEDYGRGRAMNALPSIMLLNQIVEAYMLAQEKKLNPSMYVLKDAVVGNGVVDTSAGAITTLMIDKSMPNVPPTGKLFDIQDVNDVKDVIEALKETIANHFMIDRLINMNNDREMTAREALLRNAIRQSTLRSVVSRILSEKFEPIINTSFNICLRRGKFGYMPNDPVALALEQSGEEVEYLPEEIVDAITSGADLYTIEYMTPAARDMQAEEANGMIQTIDFAASMAQYDNTIPAYIDAQWALVRFGEINGTNHRMFRKEADARAIVEQRNKAAQAAQEMEMAKTGASAAKDAATAQSTMAGR